MIDTNVLRCLAALLIVNSHLESFYPASWMAADGLLGASLFFALSGFGLVQSELRGRKPFFEWWGRRLSRLYPSVILVVLVTAIIHKSWRHWSLVDYALNFGLGWQYGFIYQILIFYAIFYVLLRTIGPAGLKWLALLILPVMLTVPFLGTRASTFHWFHWMFYFEVMVCGGAIAPLSGKITGLSTGGFVALIGLFVVYVAAKFVSGRLGAMYILPHLLLLPLMVLCLKAARCQSVSRWLSPQRRLGAIVAAIGGSSLEIYLIHHILAESPVQRLIFPLNVGVLFLLSIGFALLISRVVDSFGHRVRTMSERPLVVSVQAS